MVEWLWIFRMSNYLYPSFVRIHLTPPKEILMDMNMNVMLHTVSRYLVLMQTKKLELYTSME